MQNILKGSPIPHERLQPTPRNNGHQPENWFRYAANSTRIFKPISTGALSFIVYLVSSFLHGTLEPRDIGTPSRSTGTLEHRDIGTPSAQGGERAPTRGTVFFFQVPPWQSLAVSPLRVSLPSRSRRLRCPGWCTLVAGTVFDLLFFPETLRRGAVPQHQSELMGREGATWSDAPFVKLHCRTT